MSLDCRPQSASPLTILFSSLLLNRNAFVIALGDTESRKFCLIKVCGGSLGPVYEKLESSFLELLLLPPPWTLWLETVCNGGLRVWDACIQESARECLLVTGSTMCPQANCLISKQLLLLFVKKICISSISEDNKEMVMNVCTIFEGGYVEGRSWWFKKLIKIKSLSPSGVLPSIFLHPNPASSPPNRRVKQGSIGFWLLIPSFLVCFWF